jgi:aquaporin Z
MGQLWLFWAAPLLGAALGAVIWNYLLSGRADARATGATPTNGTIPAE